MVPKVIRALFCFLSETQLTRPSLDLFGSSKQYYSYPPLHTLPLHGHSTITIIQFFVALMD